MQTWLVVLWWYVLFHQPVMQNVDRIAKGLQVVRRQPRQNQEPRGECLCTASPEWWKGLDWIK